MRVWDRAETFGMSKLPKISVLNGLVVSAGPEFGLCSLASFAGSIQDVKHERQRKRDELRGGKYELSVSSWARGQGSR